jgi:N-ethylmaleimide reductase
MAPSAIRPAGEVFIVDETGQPGMLPFETPRALETAEIPGLVAAYANAARNAMAAGFDGVEIHGANGYLLDQFLNTRTNQRTDAYGGSVDNRIRLLLEVTDAVGAVCGLSRTGIRISPLGTFNDMGDEDPEALFSALAKALAAKKPAYLHVVDPTYLSSTDDVDERGQAIVREIRKQFQGPLILCGGYDGDKAEAALKAGHADLIGFGRPFIANPDLPERLSTHAPLHTPDPNSFYGGGALGYVDYLSLKQEQGLDPAPDLSGFSTQEPSAS